MPVDNNSVEIFLPRIAKPIIVDIDDMSKVMQWPNGFEVAGSTETKSGAVRSWKNGRKVPVSHIVLFGKRRSNIIIDHINRDVFDNRRCNLSIGTYGSNNVNKPKCTRKTSSKYIGVYYNKSRDWWIAQGSLGGLTFQIGKFKTEEEAARARDAYMIEYYGENVQLNFPINKNLPLGDMGTPNAS